MEHVVFFPAHDGTPAFRRVSSLEDAVRLVEHLRNVEGVEDVPVVAEVPEQPMPAMSASSSNGHARESDGPSSLGFFAS
jgi:hypothetical protein